ncbi:hypothetical protein NQ318_004993 [Aromia moschata]|uniref:Reverse transcriptase domain-containing protein n=1 Tax=Aromia moschata TaxID=1265417 RepID=A0AAV8Y946_9CUCU|nr:hypothetical protein NQ318_004993 [Aromia moschata]
MRLYRFLVKVSDADGGNFLDGEDEEETINEIEVTGDEGDLNINLKSKDDITDEYLNTMSEFNYESTINKYTRIHKNSQTSIDHIFVKTDEDKTNLLPVILKTNITDHFPIILNINTQNKLVDNNKIKNNIKLVDWTPFYNIPDVEIQAIWMTHTIQDVIQKSTNTLYVKHKERKRKCWITKGLVTFQIKKGLCVKYLGVTIDNYLRWDNHINNVVETLRTIIYKFKYIKQILDKKTMKMLYFALVESRLTYGILAWGSIGYTHLKRLEVIQKKILKIIYSREAPYSSEELYRESEVLDIRKLYFLSVILYQYKNKNSLLDIKHNYPTRCRLNTYQVPSCHKTIGQKNLLHLGPRLYNSIPENIKKSKSLVEVKKKTNLKHEKLRL